MRLPLAGEVHRGGHNLSLVSVKKWSQLLFRNISEGLPQNSSQGTFIQLFMPGDSQGLFRSIRQNSSQFGMASPLRNNFKAKLGKDSDNVFTSQASKLGHGLARAQSWLGQKSQEGYPNLPSSLLPDVGQLLPLCSLLPRPGFYPG